jgi:2'-5' RNA ligase
MSQYLELLLEQAQRGRSLWIDLRESTHLEFEAEPHCTLVFLGKDANLVRDAYEVARLLAVNEVQIAAAAGGVARFRGGLEGDPIVSLLQAPVIRRLRETIISQLRLRGCALREDDFDYTPHVTITRVPMLQHVTITGGELRQPPITFTHLCACCGDVVAPFVLQERTWVSFPTREGH